MTNDDVRICNNNRVFYIFRILGKILPTGGVKMHMVGTSETVKRVGSRDIYNSIFVRNFVTHDPEKNSGVLCCISTLLS